jgi:dTDP-4-dehydrorhamnose 3,5-epimerase
MMWWWISRKGLDLQAVFGIGLSFENGKQYWVPAGIRPHGCDPQVGTEIIYKCTGNYANRRARCFGNDPAALAIDWGLS